MPHRRKMELLVVATVFCGSALFPAFGQASRQVARVNDAGMWIESVYGQPANETMPGLDGIGREGIIWHLHDNASITYSICLADTMDETWIGQNLNYERLSYLQTTGDGTPIYEFDLVPENPGNVAVASAEDISLGVLGVSASGSVTVRGFNNAGGATPLWTYTFDDGYETLAFRALDVAADGSIVAAAAYDSDTSKSLVVILNGGTGVELNRLSTNTYVRGIELSDDGSRAALTEGATTNVIETAGMTTLHSFAVSGTGGTARLSRDGLVAAAGGFNYRAYRDTGSGWTQIYYGSGTNQWFGGGIGLSGDGGMMFVVSYNYATGYLDLTYRIIDLVDGVEVASTTTSGTGSFQDTVQRAEVSADGEIFACASWGTQDNAHPEVQIFDRDANLIGSIDTPGSPFDINLSRDGRYLVSGGKAVHANTMGNGGDAYAYEIATFCFGDLDGDGDVDLADLAQLLANYGTTSGAVYEDGDLDDDGDVDLADLAALLAVYGTTCP